MISSEEFLNSMKSEMVKNEHLKLILEELVSMGMSEDEGLDLMIFCWLNRIMGELENE